MIELIKISKHYGNGDAKVNALKNIFLSIKEGEMIAIVGPSGSGKSTLLNILGCIDKQSSGKYILNRKEISNCSKNEIATLRGNFFGFILQYFALIDDYTVLENIKIPLDYSRISKKVKRDKILEISKKLNIEDKLNKYPYEISGGQCQRVAIARALINNPQVILADEPTGSLDQENSKIVMNILREINHFGKTIIIVTHDETVAKCCERRITIVDGSIV